MLFHTANTSSDTVKQKMTPQDSYTKNSITPTKIVPSVIVTIPPTPLPTIIISAKDNLDGWIEQSNWPANLHSTVRRIVLCESGGIPGIATNPPHYGLMQANVNYWGYPSGGPVEELNQGFEIYKIQGFKAWSCY